MLRTFLSVVAAALLISVILFTPASSADTGEASIPSGGYKSWPVNVSEAFTLRYTIEASEGSTVNILMLSEGEYQKYLEGRVFSYMAEASEINTSNGAVEVPMVAGNYYLVVENGDAGGNMTSVNYRINAAVPSTEESSLTQVLAAGAIAILGLVLVLFLDVVGRKRRE